MSKVTKKVLYLPKIKDEKYIYPKYFCLLTN